MRWVGFSGRMPKRQLAVDLALSEGKAITVTSDSTFSLDSARTVYLGSMYPDFQLVHTRDMHIYENFAAIEKGILIDRTAVGVEKSAGGPALQIADIADIGPLRCGRCQLLSYDPERVVLKARAERDCYLLFQDMHYPGWKAYLDSQPIEFVRADVGLRIIEVPEGLHTVEMVFAPGSLRLGLALSCLGLLLTLAYAWRMRPT
jgi:hypothetical protein